jgi:hypothetical protein
MIMCRCTSISFGPAFPLLKGYMTATQKVRNRGFQAKNIVIE